MDTITIIGSILAFKKNGITEKELRNISDCLLENFNIYLSKSITNVYYELDTLDENFFLNGNCLNYDYCYVGEKYLMKRYFNPLSYHDKAIIYNLLALVK